MSKACGTTIFILRPTAYLAIFARYFLFHFSSGNVTGKGGIRATGTRKNNAADLIAPSRCKASGRGHVSPAGVNIGYSRANQREGREAGPNQI